MRHWNFSFEPSGRAGIVQAVRSEKITRHLRCLTKCAEEKSTDHAQVERSATVQRRALLLSAACVAGADAIPAARAASPKGSIQKPFCGVTGVPSWAFNTPWEERLVDFHGHKTWCRIIGQEDAGGDGFLIFFSKSTDDGARKKLPLLVLHGGPGLPSRYLETLELLAGQGRQVIFYDQIGCGKSYLASDDTAPPAEDFSVDLFLDELSTVKAALGLKRHHILGHGWGGMLALTALSRASGEEQQAVASLSLASVPPSYRQLVEDRQKRARELPDELRDALLGSAPEDVKAKTVDQYNRRFLTSRPDAGCLNVASAGQSAVVVQALCGDNQFQVGGLLKEWNAADLLPSAKLPPTLILRGEKEELCSSSVDSLVQMLPTEMTVKTFDNAGSYAHIDAWEAYMESLNAFLSDHDQRPVSPTS